MGLKIDIDNEALEKLIKADEEIQNKILYALGVEITKDTVDVITNDYTNARGEQGIVVTGALRNSISFITPSLEGGGDGEGRLTGNAPKSTLIVGSNVEYANYIHNGTRYIESRPFLEDALNKNKGRYSEVVKKLLKNF